MTLQFESCWWEQSPQYKNEMKIIENNLVETTFFGQFLGRLVFWSYGFDLQGSVVQTQLDFNAIPQITNKYFMGAELSFWLTVWV